MTDPGPTPDFSALGQEADPRARASLAVQQVISWYGRELMQQRRSETPDPDRTAALQKGLEHAQEDQRGLPQAEEDEVQRLADTYTALYRQLTEV
ncbi:hypothetical protein ABZ820_22465 [Streptomyces diacarni]|uniref:hypothetical protein n=1 Tax=Streptomyces diacarni TaxID=2800381 RepID=UPI0033C89411